MGWAGRGVVELLLKRRARTLSATTATKIRPERREGRLAGSGLRRRLDDGRHLAQGDLRPGAPYCGPARRRAIVPAQPARDSGRAARGPRPEVRAHVPTEYADGDAARCCGGKTKSSRISSASGPLRKPAHLPRSRSRPDSSRARRARSVGCQSHSRARSRRARDAHPGVAGRRRVRTRPPGRAADAPRHRWAERSARRPWLGAASIAGPPAGWAGAGTGSPAGSRRNARRTV